MHRASQADQVVPVGEQCVALRQCSASLGGCARPGGQKAIVAEQATERPPPRRCINSNSPGAQLRDRLGEECGALLKPAVKLMEPLQCLGGARQLVEQTVSSRP